MRSTCGGDDAVVDRALFDGEEALVENAAAVVPIAGVSVRDLEPLQPDCDALPDVDHALHLAAVEDHRRARRRADR